MAQQAEAIMLDPDGGRSTCDIDRTYAWIENRDILLPDFLMTGFVGKRGGPV